MRAQLKDFVYVVMGSTGASWLRHGSEYSDHHEWAVVAHRTEQQANDHVLKLDEWTRANGVHRDNPDSPLSYSERANLKNPLDPEMSIDYTGVNYYVIPVPLSEELSEQLMVTPTVRRVVLE